MRAATMRISFFPTALAGALLVLALACAAGTGHAATRHVAFVSDLRSEAADSAAARFVRELDAALDPDVADFPPALRVAGDGTPGGVTSALDRALADPHADLVVTLGAIGSDLAARRRDLAKPVIAAAVIDGALQRLPRTGGTSGVRHLTYVDAGFSALTAVHVFHALIPFRRLAVVIPAGLLDEIPQLRTAGVAAAESLGASFTFVTLAPSAAATLAALPAGADAVGLAPLESLAPASFDSLLAGIAARRVPAFSFDGPDDVARGALASFTPEGDVVRRARRVGDAIRRIAGGDDAGTLAVDLGGVPRLTLNQATARAIGFSPAWSALGDADVVGAAPVPAGPTWTLASVAAEARHASLTFQSADRAAKAGRREVAAARGALLPQVQAQSEATFVREETAAASLGTQPERQTDGKLAVSMPLINESRWANAAIEKHRQIGREAGRREAELDAVHDATVAYLDVLRAKALAQVQHENLQVTRTNRELAHVREATGASSRADVFRWDAELASDRRSVLQAEAQVALASLELNRQLDRPLEEAFATEDATLLEPGLLTGESRLFDAFATAGTFRVFRDFMVLEGRAIAPELVSANAAAAAARRSTTAARRALWMPTVSVDGALSRTFSKDGAGSSSPALLPGLALPTAPDETWSVRVQGSMPVFDGFIRHAQLGQAKLELERAEIERRSAGSAIDARIRATLEQARASWLAIEQARLAAEASRSNFALVSDAYSRGAASITVLLDAQQSTLAADEAAANAVYDFLADFMDVERAVGRSSFFATASEKDAFFRRLDDFYRAAGVNPRKS